LRLKIPQWAIAIDPREQTCYGENVLKLLRRIDVGLWQPEVCVWNLRDGVWHLSKEAVFPGYIFIDISNKIIFLYLKKYVRFKFEFLKVDGKIRCLNIEEIQRIKKLESVEVFQIHQAIKPGQQVRIREDVRTSHAGLIGRCLMFVEKNGINYLMIEVQIFEGITDKICIPYDHVISLREKRKLRKKKICLSFMDGILNDIAMKKKMNSMILYGKELKKQKDFHGQQNV
jgi:transcription antitermination factor NusG